jgi:hypothetical protein
MSEQPKQSPDFYVKARDQATNKYKIVGAGWRKEGTYGPYISLSIGEGAERKSYLMDEARKKGGDLPPEPQPKPSAPVPELDDQEIPF